MSRLVLYSFVKYIIEECYKILGMPIVTRI